ncbi:MAG TPA: hypothetical protein VN711_05105 [Candidatus Saccharimonadales bacterium]|nr:hypothetical protein [Candidatus Saccharimonadales bacterium]
MSRKPDLILSAFQPMQSFLLIAKNAEKRKEYIDIFCKNHTISKFDQTYITTEEPSIGITEVRNMQKTLFLKPYQGEEKAVILEDAHLLTTEAQNALLKVLEEPPSSTYLFLSAPTTSTFLPTILSRCSLVKLEEEEQTISPEEQDTIDRDVTIIGSENINSQLALAEKISLDKDNITKWFEQVLDRLRKNLLENPTDIRLAQKIHAILQAYKIIQTTNANARLVIEHALLSE